MTAQGRAYLWFFSAACFTLALVMFLLLGRTRGENVVLIAFYAIAVVLFVINGLREYRKP